MRWISTHQYAGVAPTTEVWGADFVWTGASRLAARDVRTAVSGLINGRRVAVPPSPVCTEAHVRIACVIPQAQWPSATEISQGRILAGLAWRYPKFWPWQDVGFPPDVSFPADWASPWTDTLEFGAVDGRAALAV